MNIPLVKTVAGVASFAAFIPTPVTVAVGVAGMVTFAAVRKGATRPSDAVRMAEDGVSKAASHIARRTRELKAKVRTEYAARQIDAAQRALETTLDELQSMSPAERAAYDAAQAQIMKRVDELHRARRAKRKVQPRRATSEVHA